MHGRDSNRWRGLSKTIWFIVPAAGRVALAEICLRQLRRTCDALTAEGIHATAVVVADDENLATARHLGFGTVERDNRFLSRKFNDGIQYALDPDLQSPPSGVGCYEVIGRRAYQGFSTGETFVMRLDRNAEARAIARRNIRLVGRGVLTYPRDAVTPPDGWDGQPVDYICPFGSDDFADHRLFLSLPGPGEVRGFRLAAFVNEDATQIVSRSIDYTGGVGIRIYPREVLRLLDYRPADEHRERGCDTSILVNVARAAGGPEFLRVRYGDLHEWQIVDWKTRGEQLTPYEAITARHRRGTQHPDPFRVLSGLFPDEALREMRHHYQTINQLRQEEVAANG